MRPGQDDDAIHGDLNRLVTGVALVPGTGEYALATEALEEELPNCGSVTMVVSWFGDDLRCGECQLKPKVEQRDVDGAEMAWSVSGLSRTTAEAVPRENDRPVYGGTPADDAVVEALRDLKTRGQRAVFYPFILMEQLDGNQLPDPWSGQVGQPRLPWRGRITTNLAPTQDLISQFTMGG